MARASAARSSSRLRALLRDVSLASSSRSAAASRSTRSSMWEYRCGKSSGADAPKSTRQESRDSTLGARFPRSRRDTFVRLFEPRRCANSVCVRPHFLRSVRRYEGTRDDIPHALALRSVGSESKNTDQYRRKRNNRREGCLLPLRQHRETWGCGDDGDSWRAVYDEASYRGCTPHCHQLGHRFFRPHVPMSTTAFASAIENTVVVASNRRRCQNNRSRQSSTTGLARSGGASRCPPRDILGVVKQATELARLRSLQHHERAAGLSQPSVTLTVENAWGRFVFESCALHALDGRSAPVVNVTVQHQELLGLAWRRVWDTLPVLDTGTKGDIPPAAWRLLSGGDGNAAGGVTVHRGRSCEEDLSPARCSFSA